MQIKKKTKKDITIISLSGEIEIETVPKMKVFLKEVLLDSPKKVLLDMKGVDYIDSTGIAALMGFSKKISENKGRMALSDLPAKIASILRIIRADKVFSIYGTEDEAIDDLS